MNSTKYCKQILKKKVIFVLALCGYIDTICFQPLLDSGKKALDKQNFDSAYSFFSQALLQITTQAEKIEAGNCLLSTANSYYKKGDIEQACTIFQQLAHIFPDSCAVQYNLGMSLVELTFYSDAIDAFKKGLRINPKQVELYVSLATALLAIGDYEQGWKLYEMRWLSDDKRSISLPIPRWNGKENLNGKKILLLSEGALGDCLQFVRYAALIKQLGAHVTVQIPPQLQQLLAMVPYKDELVLQGAPLGKYDFYTSLMSLPALLHTTLQTVPNDMPYLQAGERLIAFWKTKMDSNIIRIGICWQADPANDANRPPLAQRSIDPTLFSSLTHNGIQFYSLAHNCKAPAFMHDFSDTLDKNNGPFMDTAALISHMHLVITVDTSIAHLSGALGIPTYLLLPFKADWRWINQGETTPWYPTMKIFRKSKHESWDCVLLKIKKCIEALVENKGYFT